jgi:hypothetical protein
MNEHHIITKTIMVSLLHPTPTVTTILKQRTSTICFFCPLKHTNVSFLTNTNTNRVNTNTTKCNAFFDNNFTNGLLDVGGDHIPSFLRSGLLQFQELSDMQRWEFLLFGGLIWIYLTARPGVLIGAIDAYLFAPLQLGFANLSGRRNLKTGDFLVGDKIGEGSFGVVYSGVLVSKNVVDVEVDKRGKSKATRLEPKTKDKVILKKVCIIH